MTGKKTQAIGVLHKSFGNWVQHAINYWIQSDLRFCENEGPKDLKSMKKGVNWIDNYGKI